MTDDATAWTEYPDYGELIRSFGAEILLEVADNDYQGDSRILLWDGDRYGVLIFGWGSCSGCDALQSAHGDPVAITKLRDELAASVHWEPSREAMTQYIAGKDWSLEFHHGAETKRFVSEAAALLAPADAGGVA